MSSASRSSIATEKDKLDAFLVSVESKLRGPFSSLDLTKTIQTAGLRSDDDNSPRDYLKQIQQGFPRMDKVVQYRVLVGLLGLEPSDDSDDLVYDILTSAQDEHEEWVKIVAGLTRGIMYADGEPGEEGTRESFRGEHAQKVLRKTCKDILSRKKKKRKRAINSDQARDVDPLYVPYQYSLLGPETLKSVIPDLSTNPHFRVNVDADILNEDESAEQTKARDGAESSKLATAPGRKMAAGSSTSANGSKNADLPFMPGMRSLTKSKSAASNRPKTSMFMPSSKSGGKLSRQLQAMKTKTALHTRKPGAVKALLSKRSGVGAKSGAGVQRSAGRYGATKPKMKMLDLSEIQGLQQQQQNQTGDTKADRKRRLMEAAKAKGLVKKRQKTDSTPVKSGAKAASKAKAPSPQPSTSAPAPEPAPAPQLQNAAAAAVAAYQKTVAPPSNAVPPAAPPASAAQSGNWEQLLDRSNVLKPEDRERIRQFFVERGNPTPDVPSVRIRLHEERSVEEKTGKQVKETLFLELDYSTFSFKKLKKTKKK